MQATKYMLQITIECLSKDSIPGLVTDALDQIDGEIDSGMHHYDDGDCVNWEISSEQVEF